MPGGGPEAAGQEEHQVEQERRDAEIDDQGQILAVGRVIRVVHPFDLRMHGIVAAQIRIEADGEGIRAGACPQAAVCTQHPEAQEPDLHAAAAEGGLDPPVQDFMQFIRRAGRNQTQPDEYQNRRQHQQQAGNAGLFRQETQRRPDQEHSQGQEARLYIHGDQQERIHSQDGQDPAGGEGCFSAGSIICFRGPDYPADRIDQGGKENSADDDQITGTHVHIADGSLKIGGVVKTEFFRIESEGIAAAALQQHHREKHRQAAGSGHEHRTAADAGEGEQEKQSQVAKLGRQPFMPAGTGPPDRRRIRTEQGGDDHPAQEGPAGQQGKPAGKGEASGPGVQQETDQGDSAQDPHQG